MSIPLYKFPDVVDYHELIDIVEKKHNINTRDYAGKYSLKVKDEKDKLLQEWLISEGYEGKAYVLNKPEGSNTDWEKGSYEMNLRIEINGKRRVLDKELDEKYPYLDYWQNTCDGINRGGVNYLCLSDEDYKGKKPEWVCEINKMIRDEVEDSPAYDREEQILAFHVDW